MYACARIHYYIYYTWKDTYHLPLSAPLIPLENAEKGRRKKEKGEGKEKRREERGEKEKEQRAEKTQKGRRGIARPVPHTKKKTRLISETGLPL